MYISIINTYVHTYIHVQTYICMYISTNIYTHICIYVIHIDTYVPFLDFHKLFVNKPGVQENGLVQ